MKLYVVRHGQTDWNLNGKIQGVSDIELNETGIEQAYELKDKIKDYKIDVIISSTLKRAKKTAEIINEAFGVDIIHTEKIVERGFGKFEGRIFETFDMDMLYDLTMNYSEDDVEPVLDLCDRISTFLEEVKEKYSDKNVLIVTHGGACRAIVAYLNYGKFPSKLAPAGFSNCEIREFDI